MASPFPRLSAMDVACAGEFFRSRGKAWRQHHQHNKKRTGKQEDCRILEKNVEPCRMQMRGKLCKHTRNIYENIRKFYVNTIRKSDMLCYNGVIDSRKAHSGGGN
jgi:hypothetical protein